MKRLVVFVIVFAMMLTRIAAQNFIKEVVVKEVAFTRSVTIDESINDLMYNGLRIQITPVSPDTLNDFFLHQTNHNGKLNYANYDKSRDDYFHRDIESRKEKTSFEFYLEALDSLEENNEINNYEYNSLKAEIIEHYNSAGVTVYKELPDIVIGNPFYLGDRYLNVYEVLLENKTQDYIVFDQNFIIEADNLIIPNLSEEEIVERLGMFNQVNAYRVQNLAKFYLPNRMVIPPGAKAKKYFAVDPFGYDYNQLLISFQGLESKFKFDVNTKTDIVKDSYTFYELEFDWEYEGFSDNENLKFVLLSSKTNLYIVDGNLLYVPNNSSLQEPIELIAVSERTDKMYFSRMTFAPQQYLDFSRNSRGDINVKMSRLKQVEKKIKAE